MQKSIPLRGRLQCVLSLVNEGMKCVCVCVCMYVCFVFHAVQDLLQTILKHTVSKAHAEILHCFFALLCARTKWAYDKRFVRFRG